MTTPTEELQHWLTRFDAALAQRDLAGALALFHPDAFWRDQVAFTWNLCTVQGTAALRDLLERTLETTAPAHWTPEGEATVVAGQTEAWLRFETQTGRARAHVRLRDGRCATLFTTLEELKGHEEPHGRTRPRGVVHQAQRNRPNWLEERERTRATLGLTEQPFCLIVGAGQGGLALAARLKRLGVPTLVVERHPRAGDAWRSRYRSLCLHDPVWYDHMPYLPFPDHWPVFTPKDKMGEWLEHYAQIMEIDLWTSSPCVGAQYDEARGEWAVRVQREGETLTVRPKHLVLATGMSGRPNLPAFEGADSFRGTLVHSSQYRGGGAWRGRRCVVIGANNSAHDIAVDLWEHEAEVTMVQRSSTLVVRSETLQEIGWDRLYSEDALARGISTERADLIRASMPYALSLEGQKSAWKEIRRRDADFYARLEAAGFQLDFGEDESGLSFKYLRRGSGYYIDVGGSELVADGRVALRSRVQVERLTPDGVRLSDGTELPADLIVCATGFGPMGDWAAELISPEVAQRIGPVWGLGSGFRQDPGPWEGELRNMWKPTAQPGLWFHGGNLQQSRFQSLHLALQLKARQVGLPTPVYGAPVAR